MLNANQIRNRSQYALKNTVNKLNTTLATARNKFTSGFKMPVDLIDIETDLQGDPYTPVNLDTWNFASTVFHNIMHEYVKTIKPAYLFNTDSLYQATGLYLSGNSNYKRDDVIRHFGKDINQDIHNRLRKYIPNRNGSYQNQHNVKYPTSVVVRVDTKHHKVHIKPVTRNMMMQIITFAQQHVVTESKKYINAEVQSAIQFNSTLKQAQAE